MDLIAVLLSFAVPCKEKVPSKTHDRKDRDGPAESFGPQATIKVIIKQFETLTNGNKECKDEAIDHTANEKKTLV